MTENGGERKEKQVIRQVVGRCLTSCDLFCRLLSKRTPLIVIPGINYCYYGINQARKMCVNLHMALSHT